MDNKRKIGYEKEIEASEYLRKHGYTILSHNFNCRVGEIDIIGMDGSYLVFIEVKYRKNLISGYPEEAVNYRKQKALIHTARFYMLRNGINQYTPCRFDVVSITGNEIVLIKNAFELS